MPDSSPQRSPLSWRLKVWCKRIYFGWKTRTWPWKVPRGVEFISTKRPPEWVFEHARKRSEAEGWKDIVP
jgi:hypothetical protein